MDMIQSIYAILCNSFHALNQQKLASLYLYLDMGRLVFYLLFETVPKSFDLSQRILKEQFRTTQA
jgi:hypothetical protein